jgi:hypothetical protein
MPASRDSFDQQQQGLSAAPSRRHNSATGASPRRPARTIRIFSSVENLRRVRRLNSLMCFSSDC